MDTRLSSFVRAQTQKDKDYYKMNKIEKKYLNKIKN